MLSSLRWLAGQLASCSVPRCKTATYHRAPGASCRLPLYITFFVCLRAPLMSLLLSSVPICRLCSTSTSSSAGAAQCHGLRLRFPCACTLPDYGKHALVTLRVAARGVLRSVLGVLLSLLCQQARRPLPRKFGSCRVTARFHVAAAATVEAPPAQQASHSGSGRRVMIIGADPVPALGTGQRRAEPFLDPAIEPCHTSVAGTSLLESSGCRITRCCR